MLQELVKLLKKTKQQTNKHRLFFFTTDYYQLKALPFTHR